MALSSGGKARARLLLVENDPWDAGLVQEALDELEERPQDNLLGRAVDLFHAETLEEAALSFATEVYDLIVLDLAVSGAPALHPFLRLRDLAPDTPFVILTTHDDEPLALTALREGAAGYLLKEDLDCLPLARALRSAFERQQAFLVRQALPGVDELTGLRSRTGFLHLGEMARRLARRWGHSARLSLVTLATQESADDVAGRQARDLAIIEAADMMRDLFGDADLLGRTGSLQFAALVLGYSPEGSPAQIRTDQWLAKRLAHRPGATLLAFETADISVQQHDAPLEDLLRIPLHRVATVQK